LLVMGWRSTVSRSKIVLFTSLGSDTLCLSVATSDLRIRLSIAGLGRPTIERTTKREVPQREVPQREIPRREVPQEKHHKRGTTREAPQERHHKRNTTKRSATILDRGGSLPGQTSDQPANAPPFLASDDHCLCRVMRKARLGRAD